MSDIKKEIFGAISPMHANGGCKLPSFELLNASLEGEESVARCFCTGCCTLFEINKQMAEEFSRKGKVDMPSSLQGKYFLVGGCPLCDSKDESVFLQEVSGDN